MTSIVMLVKDRPRLTRQALQSLYDHTPKDQFTLTIVDDGSSFETRSIISGFQMMHENLCTVRISPSKGHTAMARNLGVYWSEHYWGRGGPSGTEEQWLYLSDNDVYFKDGWLEKMKRFATGGMYILGGCRHPYHKPNHTVRDLEGGFGVEITDAVAGYSQLMWWSTWDEFGPHVETGAPGVGQSEDWAMCRKIVESDSWNKSMVGYITPSVVLHTGVTNTLGEKATGADQFEREEGVLFL
jgi:hypothetical protein